MSKPDFIPPPGQCAQAAIARAGMRPPSERMTSIEHAARGEIPDALAAMRSR